MRWSRRSPRRGRRPGGARCGECNATRPWYSGPCSGRRRCRGARQRRGARGRSSPGWCLSGERRPAGAHASRRCTGGGCALSSGILWARLLLVLCLQKLEQIVQIWIGHNTTRSRFKEMRCAFTRLPPELAGGQTRRPCFPVPHIRLPRQCRGRRWTRRWIPRTVPAWLRSGCLGARRSFRVG